MVETPGYTADELIRLNMPGNRTELVRGVLLVREPAGFRHGVVSGRVLRILAEYADTRRAGLVLAAETGFKLQSSPDTVRAPDACFVRSERVPDPLPSGFAELAPDLAVEVLSPGERPGDVLAKVADWLSAGTGLVWVVDPDRREARVYRADGTQLLIPESGTLDGERVLPGLSVALSSILP